MRDASNGQSLLFSADPIMFTNFLYILYLNFEDSSWHTHLGSVFDALNACLSPGITCGVLDAGNEQFFLFSADTMAGSSKGPQNRCHVTALCAWQARLRERRVGGADGVVRKWMLG